MESTTADSASVALTNDFGMATWNRQRSDEELRAFITSHHDRLPDDVEVE